MTAHRLGILLILGLSVSAGPAHSQSPNCMWDRYCGCPGYDAVGETADEATMRAEVVAAVLRSVMEPQPNAEVPKTVQRRIRREFADDETREHLLCFLEARGLLSREAAQEAAERLAADEPGGRTFFWEPVGNARFQYPASQLRPYQIPGGPLVHGKRFGRTQDPDDPDSRPWMTVTIATREYTFKTGDDHVHKGNRWNYHLCGDDVTYSAISIPPPSGRLIVHRCPRGEHCDWKTADPCP